MVRQAHFYLRDAVGDGDGATAGSGASAATSDAPSKGATDSTTDDSAEAALGDAGKRALKAEREGRRDAERRAAAAEKERDDLRAATQSESEKAVTEARKQAATEERQKWEGLIRRTRVESALIAAGALDPDLAAMAPEFADLKVSDTGQLDGLDSVIESFKKAHPRQFAATAPSGSVDQGVKPNNDSHKKPVSLEDAVAAAIQAQTGRSV